MTRTNTTGEDASEDNEPEGEPCYLCPVAEDDIARYSTDEAFLEHVEEEHPDVPSPEEAEELYNEYVEELEAITERLDEMAEEYWELPYYFRQLRVKDELEAAANRTGRAGWEMSRWLTDEGDSR